jgi:hypothetical protein
MLESHDHVMAFLCTGCTVLRGHMDVKERLCTGCTVRLLVPDKT